MGWRLAHAQRVHLGVGRSPSEPLGVGYAGCTYEL